MKIIFKVVVSVLALGIVILVGLHLFLQYGLTKTMREVVLPQVKEQTGIDARVGGLSLNVPNGILHLNDVVIKNPDGFLLENLASVDRVQVEVDIPSLFKQKLIKVKNIEVKNALVNVVRNKDGVINVNKLQEGLLTPPEPAPGEPVPQVEVPEPQEVPPAGTPAKQKPLPEVLVEALQCQAMVRYVDFKLNQLDIALDLNVNGINLSTQRDPETPWGDISVVGSLGNDRSSFITDLNLRLAPVVDPQAPSFDLTGKVLEIDPRIMDDVYDSLGIRSAPFGLVPNLECRDGWLQNSSISLNLVKVELEDKLSRQLGGMGTIESLRFAVPIEGPLNKPRADISKAFTGAIGGNVKTLLDSFLKGAAAKKAGLDEQPSTLGDAAVEALGAQVEEIGGSETIKNVLKDLADGEPSATNAPSPVSSDTIVDILGEQVKEIGESEELKDTLKGLGKKLFGK